MEKVGIEDSVREQHKEYELFNTEEYRKQVFSMFGGESQRVTLMFDNEMLSDIFDRFGDGINIRKIEDDKYITDVVVQLSKPFFMWVMGALGSVKIVSPKKVLNEFNDFIEQVKAVYSL